MTFDWQPLLQKNDLRLRPLIEADRDALYAIAADPLLWAMHPAHDRHQRPVFDAFLDSAFADRGGLVAEHAGSEQILGFSRYSAQRCNHGEIEIGWTFIARSQWGRGVNDRMKALMIAHAFAKFKRILFVVGEENLRSRRAVEKLGARHAGREMEAIMAGQPVRHLIYELEPTSQTMGDEG